MSQCMQQVYALVSAKKNSQRFVFENSMHFGAVFQDSENRSGIRKPKVLPLGTVGKFNIQTKKEYVHKIVSLQNDQLNEDERIKFPE